MANSMQKKIGSVLKEKYGITVDWDTYCSNGKHKSWAGADMSKGVADGRNRSGHRCTIKFYCLLKDVLASEIDVAGWNSIVGVKSNLDDGNEIWIDTK